MCLVTRLCLDRHRCWQPVRDGIQGDHSRQRRWQRCARRSSGAAFCVLLGTVAGNLAPIHLPFGSIYLVGGVACAFSPLLADFSFLEAFRDKGRFAGFMFNFSVSVIDDDYAALTGAAADKKPKKL